MRSRQVTRCRRKDSNVCNGGACTSVRHEPVRREGMSLHDVCAEVARRKRLQRTTTNSTNTNNDTQQRHVQLLAVHLGHLHVSYNVLECLVPRRVCRHLFHVACVDTCSTSRVRYVPIHTCTSHVPHHMFHLLQRLDTLVLVPVRGGGACCCGHSQHLHAHHQSPRRHHQFRRSHRGRSKRKGDCTTYCVSLIFSSTNVCKLSRNV